ncbi:MAG: SufE family protein [Bacteroidales bacterium]|jgi:cysteine desulfuration protein SufE|nr:SufE family protein [Bacteroidales bacterium]
MTIDEIQDEIIAEFNLFEDWMDKYAYLIEQGKELPLLKEEDKLEKYLIDGCQSRVWVKAQMDGETMNIVAESDAVITKGIIALLLRVFNHQKPQDVYDANLYFIDKIGLTSHLSPTRSNGLLAMVKQIKLYALAFIAKS